MKKIKKKMGRPTKNQNETEPFARERILETALVLFTLHGINNVGVDRIIKEANVAKMTFFKYFPSKKDLIISFLELRDEKSMAWINEGINKITSDKSKRLGAFIKVMNQWFLNPEFSGCAFINRTAELGAENVDEKELCLVHKKKMAKLIEEMAKDASLKDPAKFAMQLVMLIDGATVQGQMDTTDVSIKLLNETSKILIEHYKT